MKSVLEEAPRRAPAAHRADADAGDGAAMEDAGEFPPRPTTPRSFRCRCGRPVFFRNSRCLACGAALGYDPERAALLALEPGDGSGGWRAAGEAASPLYWRCANFDSAAGCNWLLAGSAGAMPEQPLCRACRLNRTLPDLSRKQNRLWWRRIELAKRRLVSALIGLGLPVASRVDEDPAAGLAFDLMHEDEQVPRVVSGYRDGIVTINIEEADDAKRERVRAALHEPCRTLLGLLRYEVGHYYWQRLVAGGPWHAPFRALFGDERADHAQSLQRFHADAANTDWASRHVSAYAGAHPSEDWAETFAHYLHMTDTLDTAQAFGIDARHLELRYEPFTEASLYRRQQADGAAFLGAVNRWMEVTGVLNELARSMGQPDFYPFVLSSDAVRKLHFVHLVVLGTSGRSSRSVSPIGGGITGGSRTGTGLSTGVGS